MVNNPPRPEAILDINYLNAAFTLPVLTWPDKRLHQECELVEVDEIDNQFRSFVASMIKTMRKHQGVGLAAPQVGVLKQIITIEIPQVTQQSDGTAPPVEKEVNLPFVLINPKIIETGDAEFSWDEGCLSVPGYFEKRNRPQRIVVQYLNDNGQEHTIEFQGLHAFAIQHEIDHLNGKLFVDHLSQLKKDRIRKKVRKALNKRL